MISELNKKISLKINIASENEKLEGIYELLVDTHGKENYSIFDFIKEYFPVMEDLENYSNNKS